jgi:hypothetical protein
MTPEEHIKQRLKTFEEAYGFEVILAGKKRFEMRGLESITLCDGSREIAFDIKSASIEGGEWLWECFPNFLQYGKPVMFIELGEVLK